MLTSKFCLPCKLSQFEFANISLASASMPVPVEALIPFGIIAGFFTLTGTGLQAVKYYSNDKKPPRYNLDFWDEQMMERDRRLTGTLRGQSTEPVAPTAFSTNSVWYLEKPRNH